MEEHLKHLAFLQYEKFHSDYGDHLLQWKDTSPTLRRCVLKRKTIGLVMHDRVLVQDARLPEQLKVPH